MPKDVVIGSYYTAMGIYSGWEKDFPLLRKAGIDFFAQSWIWSHCWLMPEVSGSIRCSDAEVSRGLEHGALGSITCDWGDFGHFQLVGQTWYPSVYHAASAWTGAKLDRDYFNRSYCRVFYGTKDDGVARSIKMLGDINVQQVKVREPSGKVVQAGSLHYWEFWNDPFADPNITKLAAPASTGEDILNAANLAASQLAAAAKQASRNRDNLEQLLLCRPLLPGHGTQAGCPGPLSQPASPAQPGRRGAGRRSEDLRRTPRGVLPPMAGGVQGRGRLPQPPAAFRQHHRAVQEEAEELRGR